MSIEFCAIGNFNIDHVISYDGTVSVNRLGGNAVYTATSVHIWNKNVGIVAMIPNNFPQEHKEILTEYGIDISLCDTKMPDVTLEEWFFYEPDGSRTDHIYAPKNSVFPDAVIEKIPKEKIQSVKEYVRNYQPQGEHTFASFRSANPLSAEIVPKLPPSVLACHLLPNRFENHIKLSSALKKKKIIVSLDPALYEERPTFDQLLELLDSVDIFLPSKKEMEYLFPNEDIFDVHKKLASSANKTMVIGIKLGGVGCLIYNRRVNQTRLFPVYPSNILDLTGAGDSFCGGFLVGYCETDDPFHAALYGTVSASLMIEKKDMKMALSYSRKQAEERLELLQHTVRYSTPH